MKIAFIVSSIGDTDLALNTIKSMEQNSLHKSTLISLTKTAQQRIDGFKLSSHVDKKSLPEILHLNPDLYPEEKCTEEQLKKVTKFLTSENIHYLYIGVPSVSNEIPFQIAEASDNIPVLIAYEFMFKPETHCLWNYVPVLKMKSNIQWALPLTEAIADFGVDEKSKVHLTGHLSIDNAYSLKSPPQKTAEEIKTTLQVIKNQSLAFISSTTQPISTDIKFLDCLLTELSNHPNIQVRLGLHPGIQDLDTYLNELLVIYKRHMDVSNQFKIILPDNLIERFKHPELTINAPQFQELFLRVNINGTEASFAADRVAQAVPGALLNQAVLEGKPSYSHFGKPYLPNQYFSNNINGFFSGVRQKPPLKTELGLDEKSAPEKYTEIMIGSII
ncbi:hypothetical protein Lsan_3321 [Legionella santicrucis]|uniref:Uncharacterized protein n=1 Tax=Legionella santicrucis TaxID=45074 RepID=A0A0W0YFQ3_9GAMM|nr:hypothetical protein [Legionella santicrucis]KTD55769.1 hypothetical protein Lsan_3321 [Legionella santicrucis]